jgi:hypothetical protein
MSKHDSYKTNAFILEVGSRAVLALSADSIAQARDLCTQHWFMDELGSYRSGGRAVWDGAAELTIRCANPCEAAKLDVALAMECARGEHDGFLFAFLVPLDAIPQ